MKHPIITACIIVLLITLCFAIWSIKQENFFSIESIEGKYQYIIHDHELIPDERISSFIVEDNCIYVFYDRNALVNVYLLDGSFNYGIQVSTIRSGQGDIAFQNGCLYIKSRKGVIFVFRNTELVTYYEASNDLGKFHSTRSLFAQEKSHVSGGEHYILLEESNDIVTQEHMNIVIDFPQKSKALEYLLVFDMLLLVFILEFYRRRRQEKE